MKILIALAFLLLGGGAALAAEDDGALDEAARTSIRQVIASQLDAFKRDAADEAFAYAAPGIRATFGTAAVFMGMVVAGYYPIYRARNPRFGTLSVEGDEAVQRLSLEGPDGRLYDAWYAMERQPDGSWRIQGVRMAPSDDSRS